LKQSIYTFVYLTDGSITYIIYLPLNKGGTHKNCKLVTLHGEGVTVAGTKKETLDVRLEPTG
jgi:hypothetical protein